MHRDQIAAISGHVTLAEVQRYTRNADQVRLARDAIRTVSNTFQTIETRTEVGKPK